MILYLDTSAFVKLILSHEPGADDTRGWFEHAESACISVITYPEATSALCRQDRESGASEERLTAWLGALEAFWRMSVRIPVLEQSAAYMARTHALRGMDAVQLAAAFELRARVLDRVAGADFHFAAFDRQLLKAARREGFATLGRPLD